MIKLLFLITEDWYFLSHRLSLARVARDKGYDVIVATRVDRHRKLIEKEGFKLVGISLQRNNRNPFKELISLFEIYKIIRHNRPDIIHNVAIKPILYGTLLARLLRTSHIVNTFAGLGFIFTSDGFMRMILRYILSFFFRLGFLRNKITIIFQNPEDKELFIRNRIIPNTKAFVIKGSGVDTNRFTLSQEPDGTPIIVLLSRMLWDKGVGDLVDAARQLKRDKIRCRVVLIGSPDPQNPSSISEDILKSWQEEGVIEWWGYQDDIPGILSRSHVVVLPSYREGLPKVLLEAAASGRPIVATDVPGCREICRHNENGYLVKVKDPTGLKQAIQKLVEDGETRQRFGRRGREIVLNEFSEDIVVDEMLKIYETYTRSH